MRAHCSFTWPASAYAADHSKGTTIERFIEVVDDYIRWYNEKRIKISLGSLSPIEYRVSLGLAA
ncbi:hypothetical protein PMI14_05432 [Acidovorax sp. CF316]|nr:hypothetical protein PMI14_05432 [Acidovorax sp. CF316]